MRQPAGKKLNISAEDEWIGVPGIPGLPAIEKVRQLVPMRFPGRRPHDREHGCRQGLRRRFHRGKAQPGVHISANRLEKQDVWVVRPALEQLLQAFFRLLDGILLKGRREIQDDDGQNTRGGGTVHHETHHGRDVTAVYFASSVTFEVWPARR
jgi:hypothetical protein